MCTVGHSRPLHTTNPIGASCSHLFFFMLRKKPLPHCYTLSSAFGRVFDCNVHMIARSFGVFWGLLLLRSYLGQVGESLTTLELSILYDTSVCIAGEVASPLHKRAALGLARRDRVEADSADDAGVAELRLGRDDRVGDVVVNRLFVVSSATSNANV